MEKLGSEDLRLLNSSRESLKSILCSLHTYKIIAVLLYNLFWWNIFMKKLFIFFLVIVTSFSVNAKSLENNFPKDKEIKTIIEFFLKESPIKNGEFDMNNCFSCDNFSYLFENNKKDWVLPFCKAFNSPELKAYKFHFGMNPYWTNPIKLAVEAGDIELAKEIVKTTPCLVPLKDTGGKFDGAEPIRYAVEIDNIELVSMMIKHIPNLNEVVCQTDKECWEKSYGTKNLLNFVKSDSMLKLLIDNGCSKYISCNGMSASSIIDDCVNVRDAPGFNGKKIDKLNKGESIEVLGWDYKEYDIDGFHSGHWIHIKYKNNKTGYVWQKYIDNHLM